jgi:hypothetical protein
MNPHFKELAQSTIRHAIERSKSAKQVEHLGFRGRAREIFAQSMLAPFLESNFGVCTGFIVDSRGNSSRQIDIIIYDKSLIPSIMFSVTEGIVPVESVLAAIEVKSTLTAEELRSAIQNARSVKALQPDFREIDDESGDTRLGPSPKSSVLCCLYSFTSNVTSARERDRILEIINDENAKSAQQVIIPLSVTCIGDESVFFGGWDRRTPPWIPTIQFREDQPALRFISCLIDQVSIAACQRKKMTMSHYFLEDE